MKGNLRTFVPEGPNDLVIKKSLTHRKIRENNQRAFLKTERYLQRRGHLFEMFSNDDCSLLTVDV